MTSPLPVIITPNAADERGIDGSVDAFGNTKAVIVVQHQNGTSAVAAMRDISAP